MAHNLNFKVATCKRLIKPQRTLHQKGKPYRAFDVHNLGGYKPQWWQRDRLQGAAIEHRQNSSPKSATPKIT